MTISKPGDVGLDHNRLELGTAPCHKGGLSLGDLDSGCALGIPGPGQTKPLDGSAAVMWPLETSPSSLGNFIALTLEVGLQENQPAPAVGTT